MIKTWQPCKEKQQQETRACKHQKEDNIDLKRLISFHQNQLTTKHNNTESKMAEVQLKANACGMMHHPTQIHKEHPNLI